MDVTVRAVHRIPLESDGSGRITARSLNIGRQPLPNGASVVLECGDGWWIHRADLVHIHEALSNVSHISVTGRFSERRGGYGQFGLIYGLDAIAASLGELAANPPLFETA